MQLVLGCPACGYVTGNPLESDNCIGHADRRDIDLREIGGAVRHEQAQFQGMKMFPLESPPEGREREIQIFLGDIGTEFLADDLCNLVAVLRDRR